VLLEAGVTWAAGESFFLSMHASTTLGDVLVRVQDLKLAGTLRMTMKPFVRHPPFVSQVRVDPSQVWVNEDEGAAEPKRPLSGPL
jgi:hypothetical protein